MEHKISQVIEAVLLSASRPIDVQEIERVFPEDEKPTREEIRQALQEIEEQCKDRGVQLKKVSSGYRLQVRQNLSGYVAKLWEERPQRFSKATLETLALIAYRQPITRGEIEEIRQGKWKFLKKMKRKKQKMVEERMLFDLIADPRPV